MNTADRSRADLLAAAAVTDTACLDWASTQRKAGGRCGDSGTAVGQAAANARGVGGEVVRSSFGGTAVDTMLVLPRASSSVFPVQRRSQVPLDLDTSDAVT